MPSGTKTERPTHVAEQQPRHGHYSRMLQHARAVMDWERDNAPKEKKDAVRIRSAAKVGQ